MDASEIEEVEKDDTCSDRTYGGDSGSGIDLGLSIDARLAVNVMADINAVRVFDVSGLLGKIFNRFSLTSSSFCHILEHI